MKKKILILIVMLAISVGSIAFAQTAFNVFITIRQAISITPDAARLAVNFGEIIGTGVAQPVSVSPVVADTGAAAFDVTGDPCCTAFITLVDPPAGCVASNPSMTFVLTLDPVLVPTPASITLVSAAPGTKFYVGADVTVPANPTAEAGPVACSGSFDVTYN